MRKKQVKELIKLLEKYKDEHIEKWSDETFIKDIIYFLGITFNKKYLFSDGFNKFTKKVIKVIGSK